MTPASFEPTIDYVVTKMPRFTFEKFPGAEPMLTTSMKSVGEAMAIGRSFAESVQKALRSMETGLTGFNEIEIAGAASGDRNAIRAALAQPTPDRLLVIAQAYRYGLDDRRRSTPPANTIPGSSSRSAAIVAAEAEIRAHGLPARRAGPAARQADGLFRRAAGRA